MCACGSGFDSVVYERWWWWWRTGIEGTHLFFLFPFHSLNTSRVTVKVTQGNEARTYLRLNIIHLLDFCFHMLCFYVPTWRTWGSPPCLPHTLPPFIVNRDYGWEELHLFLFSFSYESKATDKKKIHFYLWLYTRGVWLVGTAKF